MMPKQTENEKHTGTMETLPLMVHTLNNFSTLVLRVVSNTGKSIALIKEHIAVLNAIFFNEILLRSIATGGISVFIPQNQPK